MTTYAELNRKNLHEADDLMRKHDLTLPSEKSWGAFVDAGKAAAESRSQMLGTHRNIAQFVLKLDKESPKLGLHYAFGNADALHANLFEDQSPEESVRAEVIRKFREVKIEGTFLSLTVNAALVLAVGIFSTFRLKIQLS